MNETQELQVDTPLFNKRQFWPYKRFQAKQTLKSIKKSLKNSSNKNTNSTQDNKQKNKKTKIFHLVNNKITTDRDLIKRLDGIYIPPAYTDVVVAKSANNKIQAIGTDNRGRRQCIR
jgi:DNA topoisomerase IB